MTATEDFRRARDFLLEHREDYATAYEGFAWPRPSHFNWALDWFDAIAEGNDRTALHIVEEDGSEVRLSFAQMAERSNRVANLLRERGVEAEDRILVMLGNQTELWETALAAMKLRAVVIPATPLLGPADLRDRVERGRVRHVLTRAEDSRQVRRGARRLHTHRGRRRTGGLAALRGRVRRLRGVPPRRPHPRRRPADAVLHLRYDGPPQTRRAHAHVVSDRAPRHHVLDRPQARRRAPEHLLARLGQARLVESVRAVERGGDRLHPQLHALRRGPAHRGDGPRGCDDVLRPADRVAHAHPGRSDPAAHTAARGGRGRGAPEPRGDRTGPARLGRDHPGRFRTDGDGRPGLQQPGAGPEDRLDGPTEPRLPGRTAGPGVGSPRRAGGRDRARPDRPSRRPDDRLPRRPGPYDGGDGRAGTTAPGTSRRGTRTDT